MNTTPWPSFDNSYARLPARFFTRQSPVPVPDPGMIRVNHELAVQLGFDPEWLGTDQGTAFIAGNFLAPESEPIATVYAGHQFGSWNPQLGDGRAILLGEVIDKNRQRFDIQLKGAGRTPYSRGGDGRSPMGPVLREYIVSEAMSALGVPTSRSLAAVSTGDTVFRERPLPGAILARVAQSHIRIGTIQYFASINDHEGLATLVDHVLNRHYAGLKGSENPVRALLDQIISRQAQLIARWQSLGFIHGVMNTDNMLLSGETIDYGPCAFMDEFDAAKVFSSIDHGGRYAYRNQPYIAHWNLSVLTQALLPFLDDDPDKALEAGQAAIDAFPGLYQDAFLKTMLQKLGLNEAGDDSEALVKQWFELMQQTRSDFTLSFRALSDMADPATAPRDGIEGLYRLPDEFTPWVRQWRELIASDGRTPAERQAAMYAENPAIIPRNHLVEEVIQAAESGQGFKPFHRLVDVLSKPYDYHPDHAVYASPPRPGQHVTQTFCGT